MIHAMEVVTAGTSVVYGGAGRDTIIVSALGPATIDGGEGIDRIHLGWLEPALMM
ncbi:hypothetical protein [Neotabrizicola sp. VNH66]|uniref:hypothetical protein n=1 Tax=Neotabrizicola sp. VNH66 TaxID=3400918 RepID=UPI003C0D2942